MALCIGQYVAAAVFDNCQRNSVVGRIQLIDGSIRHLELVGNLPAPYQGRWISLRNAAAAPVDLYIELPEQIDALARQQIGAFGGLLRRRCRPTDDDSTAAQQDVSRAEADRDGQPACVDVEWHSQDGLVRIDHPLCIADQGTGDQPPPILRPSNGDDGPLIPGTDADQDGLLYDPSLMEEPQFDEEEEAWMSDEEAVEEALEKTERFFSFYEDDEDEDENDDAQGLFEYLDQAPNDTQWLMDLAEQREEPITWLLPEPLRLPRSEDVASESRAEELVRLVLARLARLNVSFHICPHLTAREAYSILIDRLLPHAKIPPSLPRTDVIANYDTSAYCPICRVELESLADPDEGAEDDW